MTSRRSRGDGGIHWVESRQRWVASVTVGYTPNGKRIVRRGSGRTKSEAKLKLREIVRDYEDGLSIASTSYTVTEAVEDWLQFGLPGRSPATHAKNASLARTHLIPAIGSRKLRDLSAEDVDGWLASTAGRLSTSTVLNLRSILRRAIARAQARDKVKRNVVFLCGAPKGQEGRRSKALVLAQAELLLKSAEAERGPMGAYIVLSLLLGARTEELRALTWEHVNLAGDPNASPPTPPHIMVWRSVRVDGDTKTRKSRRTLALPARCVAALERLLERQTVQRGRAGDRWKDTGLVFATRLGTELNAANVRRGFRRVAAAGGLAAGEWTPRELRHSFVSLLSDAQVPIEKISRLVGHNGTTVTEQVYRHQLRPVMDDGAMAMDEIFPSGER